MRSRAIIYFSVIVISALRSAAAKEPVKDDIPTALQDYVSAPDDSYKYELKETVQTDGCTIHKLELTSQTWQGIPWKHALCAYVPDNLQHQNTVLLFITGGKTGGQPDEEDTAVGVKLAQAAATP